MFWENLLVQSNEQLLYNETFIYLFVYLYFLTQIRTWCFTKWLKKNSSETDQKMQLKFHVELDMVIWFWQDSIVDKSICDNELFYIVFVHS